MGVGKMNLDLSSTQIVNGSTRSETGTIDDPHGGGQGPVLEIDLRTEPARVRFGEQQLELDARPPRRRNRLTVRVLDVVGSIAALLALAPVYAALALCVRVTSKGPILYRSPRVSQDGGVFNAYKFRSMVVDADAALEHLLATDPTARREYGATHKLRNDPRLTPIGSFIRRTSLDELPQFFNVLMGDMSLVGPRPKLPSERNLYGQTLPTVLRVKPGITGLWQVSGRSDLPFDERIFLDLDYALNRSLAKDAKICAITVRQAFEPSEHGAY